MWVFFSDSSQNVCLGFAVPFTTEFQFLYYGLIHPNLPLFAASAFRTERKARYLCQKRVLSATSEGGTLAGTS